MDLKQSESALAINHRPVGPVRPVFKQGDRAEVDPLRILWRHKIVIAIGLVLGASLGVGRAILNPSLYEAEATVELRGINDSFMGLDRVNPEADTGAAGDVSTQTYLIKSGSMRQRVIDRLSLELTPLVHNPSGFFGRLRRKLGLSVEEPVEAMREALVLANFYLEARPVGATRLLQIRTKSSSPEVSASFVNTVASEYASQALQSRSTTAIRTIQWIEGQLEETKIRLNEAESNMQAFLGRTGIQFVADTNTLDQSKLAHLQGELSAIQTDRIDKQARWELAKSSPIDSLPEILDDGRLRELTQHFVELREERAKLSSTLMPKHYKMRLMDAQIAELEETLTVEKSNLVQRIQNEYEAAAEREKMLSQAYGRQAQQIAGKTDTAAEYGALTREVESTQRVYDQLLEQLNTAHLAAAVPTETVRIVEDGHPAQEASEPRPTRDIVLGALAGGGGLFGLFFFLESRRQGRLTKVFVSPGNAGETLELPELGVIPSIEGGGQRERLNSRGGLQSVRAVREALGGHNKLRLVLKRNSKTLEAKPELVTWQQPPSLLAESFRITVTSILRGGGPDWRPAIVVTSPGPGEGKTTVASNLAIAMTQTGRRVVLIDADWRKPRLHKTFGVEREPGLVDWLVSAKTPSLEDCLRTMDIPGLTLMTAGRGAGDDAGSLAFSRRFPLLLEELRDRFDAVIIDTAPALHFVDARQLGRSADGMVLVIRAGETFRESMRLLHGQLTADGVQLLGTILNDWRPDDKTSSPYYSRQYDAYVKAYQEAD